MAIAHAMWVHGHNLQIEHPDRVSSVWRAGFFARIIGRSGQNIWIHYAVPTPVIVNDNRLRLGTALIRFRTTPTDVWVAAVHIYDGERKIATHDRLHEAPNDWEVRTFAVPDSPEIRWGVGISINIQCHIDTAVATDSFRIDIGSVGCDFLP